MLASLRPALVMRRGFTASLRHQHQLRCSSVTTRTIYASSSRGLLHQQQLTPRAATALRTSSSPSSSSSTPPLLRAQSSSSSSSSSQWPLHHPQQQQRRGLTTTAALKSKGGGGASPSGILSGVHPESVADVARIVDKAQAAADKWGVDYTEFLDPALADACLMCVGRMADVEARAWGGFERAERVRLVMGRPEVLDSDEGFAKAAGDWESGGIVALLQIEGNFLFDKADHRDFLGAAVGSGIERDRLGDILVQGEKGAQILTTPEMARFLSTTFTSVRSVPVRAVPSPLSELRVPVARVDTFSSVEASMRLDAVASAGFKMSRSKMADLIDSGHVKVNWREGAKTKTQVESGDIISLRGKGRVEVGEVSETKKGRFNIDLTRFL